jgi:hypothetical protein
MAIVLPLPGTNRGRQPGKHPDQNGELWRLVDNVWVPPSISDEVLGIMPNVDPLADRDISGLGTVALRAVRTTGEADKTSATRVHSLYTVEKDGFRHAVEVTPPARGDARFIILSHGGWGMAIEGSLSKNLNDAIAEQFPDALLIAKSPDGIGKTGDGYSHKEEGKHGLKAQGATTVALAKAFAGKRKVVSAGLSMGSVIQHHAANENFFGNPENGPVDITALWEISPARVDPSHRHEMVVTFIPQLIKHIAKGAFTSNPFKTFNMARAAADHGWSRESRIAFSHQLSELLLCATPEEEVAEITSAVRTTAVIGALDILGQLEMRARVQEMHPGQMYIKEVPKKGHEIAGDSIRVARALHKAVKQHGGPSDHNLSIVPKRVPLAA